MQFTFQAKKAELFDGVVIVYNYLHPLPIEGSMLNLQYRAYLPAPTLNQIELKRFEYRPRAISNAQFRQNI